MVDKDAIIAQLLEEIKMLRAEITMLKEKVARLEKNSSNSSKPPSSDIVKPPKPGPADGTKRKIGGQNGHQKFTRLPFKSEDVKPLYASFLLRMHKDLKCLMSGISFNR